MSNVNLVAKPFNLTKYTDTVPNVLEISLHPCDAPVIFQFDTDPVGLGIDTNSFGYLTPSITPAIYLGIGDTITIYGSTYTGVFDSPGPNQFYGINGIATANSILRQLNSLMNCINQDPNLNWRFQAKFLFLTPTIPALLISALFPGESYNLNPFNSSLMNVVNAAGNPTVTIIQIFTQTQQGLSQFRGARMNSYNYKVYVQVWVWKNQTNGGSDFVEWTTSSNIFTPYTELVATLEKPYSNNPENEMIFDISRFVRPFCNVDLPMADNYYNAITGIIASNSQSIVAYYLSYGEKFQGTYNQFTDTFKDGPLAESPVNTTTNANNFNQATLSWNTYEQFYPIANTEIFWAGRGAIPILDSFSNQGTIYPYFSTFWSSVTASGVNVNEHQPIQQLTLLSETIKLTRRPITFNDLGKPVTNAFPDYLWFYVQMDPTNNIQDQIRIEVDITYNDGTVQPTFYLFTNNVSNNGLYYVDASYFNLGINNYDNASTSVLYYNVTVQIYTINHGVLGWTNLCQQQYQLDINTEPRNYTCICFQNRYGVWENWIFEGNEVRELKQNPIEYTQSFPQQYADNRQARIQSYYRKGLTEFWTINSGWVDDSYYEWFQHLLISNEVYVYTTRYFNTNSIGDTQTPTYQWEAIKITDFKWSRSNFESLFNLSITYEKAIYKNYLKA